MCASAWRFGPWPLADGAPSGRDGRAANQAGHGGGDFWELFYFARQILTGEKAPWDIYAACDVTMAGIMGVKSSLANGEPWTFRISATAAAREAFRADHFAQEHFDPKAIFPAGHDPASRITLRR
jgi:hypothetical protein